MDDIIFLGITPNTLAMIAATIVLLMLSALISGSEAAFFSLDAKQIDQIRESRDQQDQTILSLLVNVDLLLATILVINNLVNICIAILSASVIDSMLDFGGSSAVEFICKMVIVTFLLLLFGEIAPKVLAQTSPLKFARVAAQPLAMFQSIFKPLSSLLLKAGSRFGRSSTNEISLDDLADAVDMADSTTQEERGILSGILNFVNTDVQGVMRPRVDITALQLTEEYARVKEIIIESGYSRIPVYDDNLDNIRGLLFVKDLLPYINEEDFGWQKLLRKAHFIPDHKKINMLLEEFQSTKVHMAIVVDEYGSTLGLVTLEDIIEEIVGEISDESDNDESFYTRIDDNTYLFEGKTHLNDFQRVLSLDEELLEDVQGGSETLAGLILEVKKSLPKLGDKVVVHNISMTVAAMGGQSGRRIEKIRVVTPKADV